MIMAMIRPEIDMKDSGIEYVGAIPKDWDLVRLRAYFGERKNKNKDGNETNLLSLSYGRIIRKNIDKTDGLLPASFNTYNIVEKNDIIIRPTDLQNDKRSLRTGLVTEHGIITSAYIDLMPIGNVDSRFVHYLLHSYDILKVFYNMGSGVRQGLNYSEFSKLKVPMPLLSEQQAIADYLDENCSRIDEIIAEAKASIDEYKELKQSAIDNATMTGIYNSEMKDTDYVWFHEMPKHWNLALASLLFKEDVRPVNENDVSLSLSQIDGLIPTDDMSERSLKSAIHDNWKHVIPDDLVLNRFKGHLGVFFASRYTGMVSFHYGVYHAIRDDVYAKYYEYLFHSTTYKNIFALKSNGITVGLQNLSNSNFYSVKILHPSLDEQKEIVEYLDERCKQIDSLITEKESLINDLEAYKKSLIYEVVTGKRRVV